MPPAHWKANNRLSLGLEFNLRLTDVEVGRRIHEGNLLLLKHRQLLGLKTEQTLGKEERKGVEVEMLIGIETEAKANLLKVKFNHVAQACGAGAR